MTEGVRKLKQDSATESTNRPRKIAFLKVSTVLYGESTDWIVSWNCRGLTKGTSHAILMGIQALHERIAEIGLKTAQLEFLREGGDHRGN